MECKLRLEAYLRENEVPYQVQHHPKAFTAHGVAASEHVSGKQLAKVVMVITDGKLAMLVVPTSERVHIPDAARALGANDVRLAHEEEFVAAFPDCEAGAMPPFGNMYGVPVYVDRTLTEVPTIYFQAGTHTDTMSIAFADYDRLVHPTVVDITQESLLHYTY